MGRDHPVAIWRARLDANMTNSKRLSTLSKTIFNGNSGHNDGLLMSELVFAAAQYSAGMRYSTPSLRKFGSSMLLRPMRRAGVQSIRSSATLLAGT